MFGFFDAGWAARLKNSRHAVSHWRRALMSPANGRRRARYVRLSGESPPRPSEIVSRRAIPACLHRPCLPTEAGVGFRRVTEGQGRFSAAFLDSRGPVEMKVADGTCISARPAAKLSEARTRWRHDGWVDTATIGNPGEQLFFAAEPAHHQCRAEDKPARSGSRDQPPRGEHVGVSGRKSPITAPLSWPMW